MNKEMNGKKQVKKRKKARRKNELQVSMTLICIIGILFILNIVGNNGSYGDSEIKYIQITVDIGDSLWSIAKAHSPENIDLRNTLDMIIELNDLSDSLIHPGERLFVPVL